MSLIENLEKLKHFKAVAEEGSFLAGGQKVNQTQQTVFYSVRRLEEALDSKFFIRSRHGVKLTELGKYLLKKTIQLEAFVEGVERTLIEMKKNPLKIKLGSNIMRFTSLIAPKFNQIRSIKNGLEVEPVLIESSKQLVKAVYKGDVDIAIVAEPNLMGYPSIEELSFFEEEYRFYKSTSWNLQSKNFNSAIVGEVKFLYLPSAVSSSYQNLGEELKALRFPGEYIHLSSLEAIKQLVLNDQFIGLLPASIVSQELAFGKMEAIFVPKKIRPNPFKVKIIYRSAGGLRGTAVELKKTLR